MAFITGPSLPSAKPIPTRTICVCSSSPVSRRTLLSGGVAAAAVLVANALPKPASAKYGTGLERAFSSVFFPKEGFNAPENASDKVVNQAILTSAEGKKALATIRAYDTAISDLYGKFQQDPDIELAGPVRKLISISDLRSALNVVNEAIDEDSQIQTDKVVRGIIQDIGELETAAALKKGAKRTPKKIERTTDWFIKVTGDFNKLLSFYS